jgi:hypothetical protein
MVIRDKETCRLPYNLGLCVDRLKNIQELSAYLRIPLGYHRQKPYCGRAASSLFSFPKALASTVGGSVPHLSNDSSAIPLLSKPPKIEDSCSESAVRVLCVIHVIL